MKKTLILSIMVIIIISMSLAGCAKTAIPVVIANTGTAETNSASESASGTAAASETIRETIAAAAPEIVFYMPC